MEDNPVVKEYRAFQARRLDCMTRHLGEDSPEEDALLDEADDIWWRLSPEERAYINTNHGPSHQGIIDWLDKVKTRS